MEKVLLLKEIKFRYRLKAKGGKPGSLFLLRPKDAISYINDCAAEGYDLLGVEGFFITPEGAYQPSMKHSRDIEETDFNQKEFVEDTKRYIRERADIPRIHFEVVFGKLDENGQLIDL